MKYKVTPPNPEKKRKGRTKIKTLKDKIKVVAYSSIAPAAIPPRTPSKRLLLPMERAIAPFPAPVALAEATAALVPVAVADGPVEEPLEADVDGDDGLEAVGVDPARGAVDWPSICAWTAGENWPDMPSI